jgi:hypothetical protein
MSIDLSKAKKCSTWNVGAMLRNRKPVYPDVASGVAGNRFVFVSANTQRLLNDIVRNVRRASIKRADLQAESNNLWHSTVTWIDVVAFFLAFGEFPGSRV